MTKMNSFTEKSGMPYNSSDTPILVEASSVSDDGYLAPSHTVPSAPVDDDSNSAVRVGRSSTRNSATSTASSLSAGGGRTVASSATVKTSPAPMENIINARVPVMLSSCPNCNQQDVRTRTRTYPNVATWIFVGIGAFAFIPICWIPLVVDPLKQTDHYCQSCGQKVGSIRPLEDCCAKEMS